MLMFMLFCLIKLFAFYNNYFLIKQSIYFKQILLSKTLNKPREEILLDLDKNTMENTSFAVATHTEEMDNMRKIIADHMKKSLDTAAHVHVVNEINMTQISNYIKRHILFLIVNNHGRL